jgi:hypothetical protein
MKRQESSVTNRYGSARNAESNFKVRRNYDAADNLFKELNNEEYHPSHRPQAVNPMFPSHEIDYKYVSTAKSDFAPNKS